MGPYGFSSGASQPEVSVHFAVIQWSVQTSCLPHSVPTGSSLKGLGSLVRVILSFEGSSSASSGVVTGMADVEGSAAPVRLWAAADDATAAIVRSWFIAEGGGIVRVCRLSAEQWSREAVIRSMAVQLEVPLGWI